MGLCIENHDKTENREFQSIAIGIDSNCVHSNYPYPFFCSSTNPPKLFIILSLLVKVFDACVSNLTYLKHVSANQYSLSNNE